MRSFVAAIAALIILTALVTVNSVLLCRRIDSLLDIAAQLPEGDPRGEGAAETAQKLYSLWDKTVEPLSLTVGYPLLDRADDAIEEIAASAGTDGGNYEQARRKFIDSLKRMRKLQGLTFTGIF